MVWPFKSKRQSQADQVIAVMGEVIAAIRAKWLQFSELPLKEDVPLLERITAFSVPAVEGLRTHYSPLKTAPDAILMLIIAKGVEKSGTHPREEIERALGVALPD